MSTLSEAYKDHPLHLQHIIPIDFNSMRTVPDSHTWPQSDGFSNIVRFDKRSSSIPLIDLTDSDAVSLIGHACETRGVFQLTNHGIPMKLIEEIESEAFRFFSLPARQKLRALRSPGGATGYGIARISPFFSKYMWHEGFTIIGSPIDHAKDVWPCDYQRFCGVMEEYQRKMKALAEQVTRLIFNYLDIPDKDMNWIGSTRKPEVASTALQLNCYPPCPDPNRAMGLAPHTDTFLVTLLHQSHIFGLQIFQDDAGWVPVYPTPGALVVNIGDLLHIQSNGRFPSVVHRVVVNGTCQRLSVAYFYGPPTDYCVSPVRKIMKSTKSPCYRSVTVKNYVTLKAKNLDKALSSLRI